MKKATSAPTKEPAKEPLQPKKEEGQQSAEAQPQRAEERRCRDKALAVTEARRQWLTRPPRCPPPPPPPPRCRQCGTGRSASRRCTTTGVSLCGPRLRQGARKAGRRAAAVTAAGSCPLSFHSLHAVSSAAEQRARGGARVHELRRLWHILRKAQRHSRPPPPRAQRGVRPFFIVRPRRAVLWTPRAHTSHGLLPPDCAAHGNQAARRVPAGEGGQVQIQRRQGPAAAPVSDAGRRRL